MHLGCIVHLRGLRDFLGSQRHTVVSCGGASSRDDRHVLHLAPLLKNRFASFSRYYTCIFLLGEWCSFDFSPVGAGASQNALNGVRKGLSMLYAIVGVGLNAMPMAAVQDALTNLKLGSPFVSFAVS